MADKGFTNLYFETLPVKKLLLKFSVPTIISMLVSALYNIVDQVFIGQGVGYIGNAATTVVYPFTVIALAISLLICDGSASLFSISLGKKDYETAKKSIANNLLLSVFFIIVITFIGFLFKNDILKLFGVTDSCFKYASDYMGIILIGIPFYMFTSSFNGIIRADGSPKYSMIATVTGALINLILDPVAIFVFDLSVKGAAIATVIGQLVSFIISFYYLKKIKSVKFEIKDIKNNFKVIKKIMLLGISSFIIQIAIVIVIAVSNNLIVKYGLYSVYGPDIPLSAIGIVMKVFAIVISFSVGIAVGGQPIVGYNFGLENYKRVFETYKLIIISNIIIGIISMIIFEFFPQSIISLFGSESDLYNNYAVKCFRIFLLGIVLCCIQKASSVFLQSIGKPLSSTILSLARDVIFFVPGLIILASFSGVEGLLWAAPITDTLSFFLTVILISYEFKKLRNKKENISITKKLS